jgi:hypothetical protein
MSNTPAERLNNDTEAPARRSATEEPRGKAGENQNTQKTIAWAGT